MKIVFAEHAGFCSGVKRAVRLALENAGSSEPCYTLGSIIHNRHVVENLRQKGIIPLDTLDCLDNVEGGKLIIRSHGAPPCVFEKATEKGFAVIDATCPFVKKAQEIICELSKKNYDIVIVGDHGHPEVEALVEWSGRKAYVIENPEEAKGLDLKKDIAIVAQTTQQKGNLESIVQVLREKGYNIKVYNTICNATRSRQEAALSLSREVDAMVVIGGKNSANTRKLADICSRECKKVYHIEDAGELQLEMFAGVDKVGITAGASTPDWIMEEVVEKMAEIDEKKKEDLIEEEVEKPAESTPEEEQKAGASSTEVEEKLDVEAEEKEDSQPEGSEETEDPKAEGEDEDVQEQLADNLKAFKKGDVVKGQVVQVNENEVLVDVGGKSEGVIPISELSVSRVEDPSTVVQPGDEIEVQVIKVEDDEGRPILSKRRVDRQKAWEKLQEAYKNNTTIEGTVIEVVKGGILVDVGLRGFVPASLVDRGYIENLEEFVGKTVSLKVIELDRSKNKIVLSRKAVLDEEIEKKREETWDNLEEGQVIKGIVRRLTNFGAFVDIGGVDGLLHVSEISWGRVEHPRDVLSEEQELEVKVLNVDREKERVSLGLKQLMESPWERADEKYPAGSIVKGKVLRTAPFGAFVEIEPGVEGLIHISQLAEEHVEKTEDVVSPGDEVQVKVLSVDTKEQRMSLSLKEAKKEEAKDKKKTDNPDTDMEDKDNLPESGVKIGDLYGDLLRKRTDE